SRGNFGLVWVQGKGRGRPEYSLWSRESSRRWPEFAARLAEASGLDVCYQRPGGALVALSEEELASFAAVLAQIREEAGNNGYDYEVLDRDGLRRLMPEIGDAVVGGTYCPYDGHVNSLRLFRALHEAFVAVGGDYRCEHRVSAIEPAAGGGFTVRTAAGTLGADRVVIAAGHGCASLGPMVGLDVPVYPVHGQVIVTERWAGRLALPTNIVRQTDEGTCLMGFSEDDLGFETLTRTRTLRDIAWRTSRAFPFLAGLRAMRAWGALRVMTPDGFPVYAQSQAHPGAFAVTCHSGVTLAANHAEIVAGWIESGAISPDQACFGTERFHTEQRDVPAA
ncbi:MAG: FAD-dependent oxidoreductase, partial [Ectothiorhodospiraceae bacterium]|nr:FAD-dependent oxidoreductase [Ectothiorhodospiraceae bacterium]